MILPYHIKLKTLIQLNKGKRKFIQKTIIAFNKKVAKTQSKFRVNIYYFDDSSCYPELNFYLTNLET